MTPEKQGAIAAIEEKQELITYVADSIWEFAELSLQEYKSCALYCDVLEKEGFDVEKGIAGIGTAFSARFGQGKPVIGILAEYDALSGLSQKAGAVGRGELVEGGNGHGCGHNLLGAGALAAAIITAALQEAEKPGWNRPAMPVPWYCMAVPVKRAARQRLSWPETAYGRIWTQRSPGIRRM